MTDILEARKSQIHAPARSRSRWRATSTAWPAPSASGHASSAARGWCSTRSPTPCTWSTARSAARRTPGTSAARCPPDPQLHRLSFSTDLREKDVIFGGETEARPGAARADRALPAQGGLRLQHLHRRPDRRRRRGRLPARGPRHRHPRAAGPVRGIQGHEEGRLPRRLRRPVQARRHRADRRHRPGQHQHPRRLQPGRRDLDDPASTTSAWASRWWPRSPATAASPTSAAATARPSTSCSAPARWSTWPR